MLHLEIVAEVFQTIISHGVDVNATNKDNTTALMVACINGHKDAINALLNAELILTLLMLMLTHAFTMLHWEIVAKRSFRQ